MKLLVDLDGVVFDFEGDWTERVHQLLGRYVVPNKTTAYDDLHIRGGFPDRASFWEWYRESGGFAFDRTYPGAVETVRCWVAWGHEVLIVTSRPRWARSETLWTIARLGIPVAGVVFAHSKERIAADLAFEDNPQTLYMMATQGRAQPVRVDRPWNRPAFYNERWAAKLTEMPAISNLFESRDTLEDLRWQKQLKFEEVARPSHNID